LCVLIVLIIGLLVRYSLLPLPLWFMEEM